MAPDFYCFMTCIPSINLWEPNIGKQLLPRWPLRPYFHGTWKTLKLTSEGKVSACRELTGTRVIITLAFKTFIGWIQTSTRSLLNICSICCLQYMGSMPLKMIIIEKKWAFCDLFDSNIPVTFLCNSLAEI